VDDKRKRPSYGDPRLGAFIREARRYRQISQLELGRAAGVSEPLIGAIERGDRAASPEVRAAIAKRLGVSLPETSDLAEAIQRLTEVYQGAAA
jgi:transcriptional regulator with XRE-family HTH domain